MENDNQARRVPDPAWRERLTTFIDLGLHTLVVGPPGVGKTTASRRAIQGAGRKRFAFVGNPQSDEGALVQGLVLGGGATRTQDGPLVAAARLAQQGVRVAIHVTELQDVESNVVFQWLTQVADDSHSLTTPLSGEELRWAPGTLTAVLEANPPISGLPEWLLDRMLLVAAPSVSLDHYRDALLAGGVRRTEVDAVVSAISATHDNDDRPPISWRGITRYLQLRAAGLPAYEAALYALAHDEAMVIAGLRDGSTPMLTAIEARLGRS